MTIAEITVAAAKKGMTIDDIAAMPEQDGWQYDGILPDLTAPSYICSSYNIEIYRAAGLLEG